MERIGEITYKLTEEEYKNIQRKLQYISNYIHDGDEKDEAKLAINELEELFGLSF